MNVVGPNKKIYLPLSYFFFCNWKSGNNIHIYKIIVERITQLKDEQVYI